MKLSIEKVFPFVSESVIKSMTAVAEESNALLESGEGKGNDFLGWVNLPASITSEEIAELKAAAEVLRSKCEIVVVVGIGGSYLGARAVIDALNDSFDFLHTSRKNPVILYAGQNIGEDYLFELQNTLKDRQFGIINISKSGTTTEPAIAFRILKNMLEVFEA